MVTLADVEEKSICQHHAGWQRIFFFFFLRIWTSNTEIKSFVERKSACPGHLGWKKKLSESFWFFHESSMKMESKNSDELSSLSWWPSSYLSTHSPSIVSGSKTIMRRCRLPWVICLNDLWIAWLPIRYAKLRTEPLTFHGISLVIKNISNSLNYSHFF